MHSAHIILIFSFWILWGICFGLDDKIYKYQTYDQIKAKYDAWALTYPNLIRVETAQAKYNLPSLDCGDIKCVTLIVTITHLETWEDELSRPQVVFSGALHGNEVLGPNILTYTTQYILEQYEQGDEWITYLLKNRVIVQFPMTNAQGYYYTNREEHINGRYIDPNRDFPYNVEDPNNSECLSSVTSRAIFHELNNKMFIEGISFHGGFNVIGHIWGSMNHIYENAPDLSGIKETSKLLRDIVGSVPKFRIPKYRVGTMTETTYPCNGAMEDWAYAFSWSNITQGDMAIPTKCSPTTFPFHNQLLVDVPFYSLRLPFYLVETDHHKQPSHAHYGSRRGIYEDRSCCDGHIPRNIRLSLGVLDLAAPYISNVEVKNYKDYLIFSWRVGGSIYVDSTYMNYTFTPMGENLNEKNGDIGLTRNQSGNGYIVDGTIFKAQVKKPRKYGFLSYWIVAVVDQRFGEQENPIPNIPPVTHFSQMRINSSYSPFNGKYSLKSYFPTTHFSSYEVDPNKYEEYDDKYPKSLNLSEKEKERKIKEKGEKKNSSHFLHTLFIKYSQFGNNFSHPETHPENAEANIQHKIILITTIKLHSNQIYTSLHMLLAK